MEKALISILLRRCNDAAVHHLRKITVMQRCYSGGAKPELTSVRYKIRRGPYATISTSDVRFFDSLLSSNQVVTDPDECESYNIDFPKTVRGKYCKHV